METFLLCLAIGFGALLTVAATVALLEHLRDRKQMGRLREAAMAEHAAATLDAVFATPAAVSPARPLRDPLPAAPLAVRAAEHRTPLAGALRCMAKPAVGPATSGWIETEPMVLGGPSMSHFDPTEHPRH
ncbi:MAG: hypothetical protein ABIN96_12960 [Rubrivivax sp.]